MAEFRVGQMQGSPLLQAWSMSAAEKARRKTDEMQQEQFKWLKEDRAHNKLKQQIAGQMQGAAGGAGKNLWDYDNAQVNNAAFTDLPFTEAKKAIMWQEYQQAATHQGVAPDAAFFEANWSAQKELQDRNVAAALSSAKATSGLSNKEFSYAMRGGGENAQVFNDYMSTVKPETAAGFTTATHYDPAYKTFGEDFTGPKSATLGAVAVGTGVAAHQYGKLQKKRAPLQALLENLQTGKRFEAQESSVRKQQGVIHTAGTKQAAMARKAEDLRKQAEVLTGKNQKAARDKLIRAAKYQERLANKQGTIASTQQAKLDKFQTARSKQIAAAEKKVAATKPGAKIAGKFKGKPWGMKVAKGFGYVGAPLIAGPLGGAIGKPFGYEEEGATAGRLGAYTAMGYKGARGLASKGITRAIASKSPALIRAGKLLMKGPAYSKVAGGILLSLGGALAWEKGLDAVTPKP